MPNQVSLLDLTSENDEQRQAKGGAARRVAYMIKGNSLASSQPCVVVGLLLPPYGNTSGNTAFVQLCASQPEASAAWHERVSCTTNGFQSQHPNMTHYRTHDCI